MELPKTLEAMANSVYIVGLKENQTILSSSDGSTILPAEPDTHWLPIVNSNSREISVTCEDDDTLELRLADGTEVTIHKTRASYTGQVKGWNCVPSKDYLKAQPKVHAKY